ncbi:MAG: porin [Deltaproteobacteria bacterium]|nr:porin [Deltaproteobacteria bacterium]MBW2285888.1 porin [Deltaproteobacteria bacterium]
MMLFKRSLLFVVSFLMVGSPCFGQEKKDKSDYVHRSEYEDLLKKFEALQQRLEQLEADRATRAGGEETRPGAHEAQAGDSGTEAEAAKAQGRAQEPAAEKPSATAGLHLPDVASFTPGFERAEERRLAEPNKVPAMNARIAHVGEMDLYMGFDSVGRFQYLTQDNVAVKGDVPDRLEPGFQTPFGDLSFMANFGDALDIYFDIHIATRPNPDHLQGDQGYLLVHKMPERLQGFRPLDWFFEEFDLKAGAFEIDYGDAHNRRSNNAQVQQNPLIGNYVVDPRATDIGLELISAGRRVKWLLGFGSGTYEGHFENGGGYSAHGKVWGDPIKDLRTSFSMYYSDHSGDGVGWPGSGTVGNLFRTNRSGGPYQGVLDDGDAPGQVMPGMGQKVTAVQADLTWRLRPIELYAYFAYMQDADINGSGPGAPEDSWYYYAGEGIYYFTNRLYLAARYSGATARRLNDASSNGMVHRIQLGGGYWFFDSVLAKLEFVYQKYRDFSETDGMISGVDAWLDPEFKGVIAEASFGF